MSLRHATRLTTWSLLLAGLVLLGTGGVLVYPAANALAEEVLEGLREGHANPGTHGHHGHHSDHDHHDGHTVVQHLQLSPDQMRSIHTTLKGFAPKIEEFHTGLLEARHKLLAAAHRHPPVESEVRDASAEVAAVHEELAVIHARMVNAIYSSLSASQQQRWEEKEKDLAHLLLSFTENPQAHLEAIDSFLEE